MVACQLGCGLTMAAHVRDRHERHDFSFRAATCPYCGDVKHASDLETHNATEFEVHQANAAIQSAVRAPYAPPPKLNKTAIRGPPMGAIPGAVLDAAAAAPVLPLSPEQQKMEELRERVRARRPPGLDRVMAAPTSPFAAMVSPPAASPSRSSPKHDDTKPTATASKPDSKVAPQRMRILQPPAYPSPSSVATPADVSDMSPTRRKMLLGPGIGSLKPSSVVSPREDEVLAAGAQLTVDTRPARPPVMSLRSEDDVEDISSLVFEAESEVPSPPRPSQRSTHVTSSVSRNRSPKRK